MFIFLNEFSWSARNLYIYFLNYNIEGAVHLAFSPPLPKKLPSNAGRHLEKIIFKSFEIACAYIY